MTSGEVNSNMGKFALFDVPHEAFARELRAEIERRREAEKKESREIQELFVYP